MLDTVALKNPSSFTETHRKELKQLLKEGLVVNTVQGKTNGMLYDISLVDRFPETIISIATYHDHRTPVGEYKMHKSPGTSPIAGVPLFGSSLVIEAIDRRQCLSVPLMNAVFSTLDERSLFHLVELNEHSEKFAGFFSSQGYRMSGNDLIWYKLHQ